MDDTNTLLARIDALTKPLVPQPTGVGPLLGPLDMIRAVVFDVYGTLVISGCGDIGLTQTETPGSPFEDAWAAVRLPSEAAPTDGSAALSALIRQVHATSRAAGVEHPEVDILAIWHRLLQAQGMKADDRLRRRLALEYELRTNPVWPMPGLTETLDELADRGLVLGIVSNAQFYTPLMLRAFFGRSLDELAFDEACCAWSYRQGVAKPSTTVYAPALDGLRERHGIAAHEVLYIGNDMRNDIRPAQALGCRTALFAGDARSLRLRRDDPGIELVQPDRVVTALPQVLDLLQRKH
jgi:putative hydrolase of the HAD superfamily